MLTIESKTKNPLPVTTFTHFFSTFLVSFTLLTCLIDRLQT